MTIAIFADQDIASWMRNAPKSFDEWMEQEFNDQIARLMNADDLRTIGRYQGILGMLATLKELRKES